MENEKNSVGGTASGSQTGGIKIHILDFLITASIGLIFFLTPLFFTGQTSQGIGFDKMVLFYFLTLVGVVAWATKGVINGELSLKRTPLDIPIIVVLVIFTVSTISSVSQKDSWLGSYGNSARSLAALFVFVLFYYLVVNNINGAKMKQWFWALVGSISLVIAYSLLQLMKIFVIPADFTHFNNFNMIGSSSGLTMFLAAALPLIAVAITHAKEIQPRMSDMGIKAIKIAMSIVAVGDLAVLALLNGFTFWPAAIASMVIVLMFLLSKVVKTSASALAAPIVIFFALIMLLVLGNFNFAKLDVPVEVSLSRKASWEIAKNGLAENPVFGSGPSTFYYNFAKFKDPALNYSELWNVRFDNASGVIFELLSNVGALGALAAVVVVLIALSIAFMATIKTESKEEQPIMLGLFASFIAFLIFALLFSFNNSLILLSLLIATLAISAAINLYPEKFKTLNLSFRASANYALALAAIFLSVSAGVVVLFIFGVKTYMADVYVSKAVASSDASDKVVKLNQAISLNPHEDAYYMEIAKAYLTLANNEANTGKDQTVVAKHLTSAIENGKKAAIEINPNSANNNEAMALVYENASFYTQGALELAEDLYEKQMVLEPVNPVPYLRIALINMSRANTEPKQEAQTAYMEEAIKNYDKALELKNDFGSAYYGKSVTLERMGKQTEAIDELKKAVLTASTNLDYRFELARLLFNRGVVQPNIAQTATTDITTGEAGADALSVQPSQPSSGVVKRNGDLDAAEQIFQSILAAVPNNANSLYSLALLYQKTGETDKARTQVRTLLDVLQDEQQKEMVRKQFPGLF